MGISSKKTSSKTTTNQNTTMNTQPTNPTFVTQGIEGLAGKIGDVFGQVGSNIVAGPNPLQTLAGNAAGALGNVGGYGGGGGPQGMAAMGGPVSGVRPNWGSLQGILPYVAGSGKVPSDGGSAGTFPLQGGGLFGNNRPTKAAASRPIRSISSSSRLTMARLRLASVKEAHVSEAR